MNLISNEIEKNPRCFNCGKPAKYEFLLTLNKIFQISVYWKKSCFDCLKMISEKKLKMR